MVDRRIKLLSPMGWHRKRDPVVPEGTSTMHETTSLTSECRSLENECASPQTLDSPSGSTTSRRTLFGKDPYDHQPETSKQTLAEGKDEFSRNDDSTSCTSPSGEMYAKDTRLPELLETASSSSSNATERELLEDCVSSISSKKQFYMCERKEEPKLYKQSLECIQSIYKVIEEPMVSNVHYLFMASNRNSEDQENLFRRTLNRTESDEDSAYEEESPESLIAHILTEDFNVQMCKNDCDAHESTPDQS